MAEGVKVGIRVICCVAVGGEVGLGDGVSTAVSVGVRVGCGVLWVSPGSVVGLGDSVPDTGKAGA